MSAPRAPEVYWFTDFRRFLQAWWDHQKALRPGVWSYEFFARRYKVSKAWLPNLIAGRQRGVKERHLDVLVDAVGLDEERATYLRLLVRYDVEPWPRVRAALLEQILELRAFHSASPLEREALASFGDWRHRALYELAQCPGFRADADWIARSLQSEVTPEEAQQVLDALISLGLLVPTRDGAGLMVKEPTLASDGQSQARLARAFHVGALERARLALDQPRDERQILGATFACPRERYPELREETRRFFERIHRLVADGGGKSDGVYQLSAQLFPLAYVSPPSDDE